MNISQDIFHENQINTVVAYDNNIFILHLGEHDAVLKDNPQKI